jgi:hypothetical protein
MALPDYLVGLANNFVAQYGNQIFDPTTGAVKGLPGNVQQQTAPFTDYQNAALMGVGNATPYAQNLANTGANQSMATMQGGYLPAGGWLDPNLQSLGINQTAATMSGAYLNPASNPFLAGTFQSAASPMVQAYQTATAPGNMAAAQRAGQMGSTAMNEQGQLNQYGLGQNLENLASNIYGGAYQQERGIQSNTVNQLQQSQNAAFQNERQRQLQALSMAPQTTANIYAPSNTLYGAGAQQQQQQQTSLDTNYANQISQYEAPFSQLQGYGNALLTAGGGGTTASTTTKGGSVICSLLHDKGLIDDETYEAAGKFGSQQTHETRAGYKAWAIPLTRAMDKSRVLTFILKPFWKAWQKEMKARVKGGKGSILGKVILGAGMPLCEWIGKRLSRGMSGGSLTERIKFRREILALQEMIGALPTALTAADYETRHYFTPIDKTFGCAAYARVIILPKGHVVIGKIHKHGHLNFILQGRVSVATEFGKKYFAAPAVFVSEPGLKRAVLVEEECMWATVHLTEHPGEENLARIEDEVIAKTYGELR